MARYVLYYLTEGDILNIESVSQQNLTTSNNLTGSTFTIPVEHRSCATYDMVTSEEGSFVGGRFDTSTQMNSPPPSRYPTLKPVLSPVMSPPSSVRYQRVDGSPGRKGQGRKLSIDLIAPTDAERAKKLRREIRLAERNSRCVRCCRNLLIAVVVAAATLGITYLILKQFTNII